LTKIYSDSIYMYGESDWRFGGSEWLTPPEDVWYAEFRDSTE